VINPNELALMEKSDLMYISARIGTFCVDRHHTHCARWTIGMLDDRQTDNPPLAVVIATAGRPALLERTLDSLAACIKPASYQGCWVVENGPPGTTRQIVMKYDGAHNIHYSHVARPNKSHALNLLLERIGDPLLFFTDDDVRFDREILLAYATAARGIRQGRFFGGPLGVDYEAEPPADHIRSMLPKTVVGWQRSERQITHITRPRFLGPNWAAFAEDLRNVGGFDPRLGPGAETGATGQETESQTRLRAAGISGYYVPQAMAWHYASAQSMSSEWIVERKRRHSREWGIARAQRYPQRIITRYAQLKLQWARIGQRIKVKRDTHAQLRADYEIAKWQGRLEGLALGQDWPPLPRLSKRFAKQRAA
jgi:GT2 family glycosyltransferase